MHWSIESQIIGLKSLDSENPEINFWNEMNFWNEGIFDTALISAIDPEI